LHWLAASGTPYPASAPKKYQILVSADGTTWRTILDAISEGPNERTGNVLLNTDARYVRLATTQVNDGSGWALGLREIWVTEGRDTAAAWLMRAEKSNGRIMLTWQPPGDSRSKRLRVYRSNTPTDMKGSPIATLAASAQKYADAVPNWTPYYYWVAALDEQGGVLGTSNKVAAFARPADIPSQRVETFAFWYQPYIPTTNPDRSVRHIGNPSFVVGPRANDAADLAKNSVNVLPYITLYQTHDWTSKFRENQNPATVVEKIAPIAFFRKDVRFPGSPPGYVPSLFCRPDSPSYNPQSIQYTTCPNSKPFRDMVLARVKKMLADGAFGFFVDNGYRDDIAASAVCQSTGHQHYYGENLTSADAFLGLLMEITCEVKKQIPGGVVLVNGGVPGGVDFFGLKLSNVSDGLLWESYLRSSFNTPKEHVSDWGSVYRRSVELEKSRHDTAQPRMFVLSFPWNRDEAFFCYATAKLSNLPWSAGLGITDPGHKKFGGHFGTYPELVNIKLGAPVNSRQYGGEKIGGVHVRRYEKGFVVVNPSRGEQQLVLPATNFSKCLDVYANREIAGVGTVVSLPAESGRVYLCR
jgi:hypothetical protein